MSLGAWCSQGPRDPSSCTTFTLNPHRGRAATVKKKKKSFASMHTGSLRSCSALCDSVDCGLPGFSVMGVFQARILECTGQYWLSYPSRALYLLLPNPPTPLSTWCCQNHCDPSSCTTSTTGPHWGRPKSSREASGTNHCGRPHMQRWK